MTIWKSSCSLTQRSVTWPGIRPRAGRRAGVWLQPAGLVILHVGHEFMDELVGQKFTEVAVHEFRDLARSDLVLLEGAAIFRRLCVQPQGYHDLYLESLGTLFAAHVLNAHFGLGQKRSNQQCLSPKQLRCVLAYIDANLKQPIMVEDLAREACLSMYHFIRLFKRTTGLSPHRYLVQCRVQKAHELLRGGDYRVAEAAYAVGFCDQSHLDRYFRRHFGFSPKNVINHGRAQL